MIFICSYHIDTSLAVFFSCLPRVALLSLGTPVKLIVALIFESLHFYCSLSSCISLGHGDLVMEDPLVEKWQKGILKQQILHTRMLGQ